MLSIHLPSYVLLSNHDQSINQFILMRSKYYRRLYNYACLQALVLLTCLPGKAAV